LNAAAKCATVLVFDLLLEKGARLERSIPLHMAAGAVDRGDGERIPMVAHLLQLGVDVNGLDDVQGPYRKGTPLDYAIMARNPQMVRFLLENGAGEIFN
jgi:ankyrin repeat protein